MLTNNPLAVPRETTTLSGLALIPLRFSLPSADTIEVTLCKEAKGAPLVDKIRATVSIYPNNNKRPPKQGLTKTAALEQLTKRELEVARLVSLGLTNQQISQKLCISAHTVKYHISNIMRKLEKTSRIAIAVAVVSQEKP
jgi:DNA-binding NarL/FixJ family response regulator